MTASMMSCTPSPVLALARIASLAGMPMMSSISAITRSGSAEGRSILFKHRHHLDALLDGGVAVGHGLRFHALRGIDHQQRAFARRERARHFVREIDVSGRIDQIQQIGLDRRRARYCSAAVCALIVMPRSRSRSMESSTCASISRSLKPAAQLDEAVGQRGFAVVDVGDDGKVADVLHQENQKKGTRKCPGIRCRSFVG